MSGSAKVALPRPPLRCYAVGDIHGRLDLLDRLVELITRDHAEHGGGDPAELIFLGDYVDRGPASAGVVERLVGLKARPPAGLAPLFLRGNHEALMLDFLAGGSRALAWLGNGGIATLASYGVSIEAADAASLAAAARQLEEALPAAHRAFLEALDLQHIVGPYLFVHAGVRPGRALALQAEEDLLWIRGPFLGSSETFEKFVVHGHSISAAPVLKANRLGIDTGAFCTGCLTAAVLEKKTVRFLDTGYEAAIPWLR